MSLILHIETATPICSVALGESGKLLGSRETLNGKSHASHLTIIIRELLEECKRELSDLDAVAVSKGPGSYTGLRIGVSSAKGLCYALDIPLISVDTLLSMANKSLENLDESTLFCPMLDARRMEVYCAMYNHALEEYLPVAAVVVEENTFSDIMDEHKVHFFGDGAEKCQAILGLNQSSSFDLSYQISAVTMLKEAALKYDAKEFEDVAYFEPFYLKDFVAGPPKKLI